MEETFVGTLFDMQIEDEFQYVDSQMNKFLIAVLLTPLADMAIEREVSTFTETTKVHADSCKSSKHARTQ